MEVKKYLEDFQLILNCMQVTLARRSFKEHLETKLSLALRHGVGDLIIYFNVSFIVDL